MSNDTLFLLNRFIYDKLDTNSKVLGLFLDNKKSLIVSYRLPPIEKNIKKVYFKKKKKTIIVD